MCEHVARERPGEPERGRNFFFPPQKNTYIQRMSGLVYYSSINEVHKDLLGSRCAVRLVRAGEFGVFTDLQFLSPGAQSVCLGLLAFAWRGVSGHIV